MADRPFPFAAVEVAGRKLEKADSFELAAACLWLLVRLGGVGARTRRGAGGMRAVIEPEGWPARLPALVSRATTPADLAATVLHHLGIDPGAEYVDEFQHLRNRLSDGEPIRDLG